MEAQPSKLHLYAYVPGTYALGPGFRFALWVQGCPLHCHGCMTPDAQPFSGGEAISIHDMAQHIVACDGIEGLTISGGEPFSQADGLAVLINTVRQERNLGVIVYTGYTLPTLYRQAVSNQGVANLLSCTDLLIDGPYLDEQNNGLPLRGSNNQSLQQLTPRYRDHMTMYAENHARRVEIHLTPRHTMLVGIPSNTQASMWQHIKQTL